MDDTTGRPSRSAQLVAAARMVADDDPGPWGRLCSDPYARLFVDDEVLDRARASVDFARNIWLRTRYIDDAVLGSCSPPDPCTQVLILGAGLDSRVLRLGVDAMHYEVDFPDTLAYKAAVLHNAGIDPGLRRVTVPVDLVTTPMSDPLIAAGFDAHAPTCTVCEGVTFYLSESALDDTFNQLHALLAPGSVLVLDYSRPDDPDLRSRQHRSIRDRLSAEGEPIHRRSRIIPEVLANHGFTVVDDGPIDLLPPRYGLPAIVERQFPAWILTARRL